MAQEKRFDTLLITRPTLVSVLMQEGINPERVHNPFHPEKSAWCIDLTPTASRIIASYYISQGMNVPDRVMKGCKWKDEN